MDLWNPSTGDKWNQRFYLIILLTALLFLTMQATGGVVRWILDMVGLAVAAYLPNLAMLSCITVVMRGHIKDKSLTQGAVLLLLIVAYSLILGVITIGKAPQVVFGLWVFTPFFFGIACAPALMRPNPYNTALMVAMFVVTCGGVIVHSVVAYPWVGASITVGGVELEGAREWHTAGKQRLSGLARSSFDVAGQILIAAGLLSLVIKQGWARAIMWGACVYSISLSTSKGILLALLMVVIASESLVRRFPLGVKLTFYVGIVWVFFPPLLGWFGDWTEMYRTDLDNPLYGSFIDRMHDMWPKALELMTVYGITPLGRGIGGIGVPLSMFQPDLFNAGDNVFVYVLVLIGFFVVPLFALGFLALIRMCDHLRHEDVRAVLVMAVGVVWYGGVSNILEHAMLAFAMGIVARYCAALLGEHPHFHLTDQEQAQAQSTQSVQSDPSTPSNTRL
jgi:hypothetical protein